MFQRNEPPTKLILIGALLVFIAVPLIWLAATHSFVIITASDKNAAITLTDAAGNTAITATGSYSGLVPTNTYTIATTTPTAASTELFTATPFTVAAHTIHLTPAVQSDAVTNMNVTSVAAASGSSLVFIDTATGYLEQVDSHNTLTRVGAPNTFASVAWQSATDGLAVTNTPSTVAGLVAIHAATTTGVPLPEPVSGDGGLSVAYAGKSAYYLTENNKLYRYANNTLARVAFIPSGFQLSSAAGNKVILYQAVTSNASIYNVTLLDTASGTTIKATAPLIENPNYTFSSAWSPDGTKLIISASGSSTVYDSSLHELTALQGNSSNSPVWLDNATIIYTAQNWLWHYSLGGAPSYAIAYLPKYATADVIATDQAGQYIYFTAIAGGQESLYRAALHQQPISIPAAKLGESNTQQASATCSMYYLNFTSLSMIANNPADSAGCVAAIQNYLSIISVPTTTPVQVFRP